MQITSASNERIKHARRVRDGREPGLIFIEGLRLAEEALRSKLPLEAAFLIERDEPRHQALGRDLEQRQVACFETTPELLATLSDTVQTQGVILIASRPPFSLDDLFGRSGSLFLALDRIQDPGNMGTLIRTAEAAGVSGIIALGGSVDVFSPKVLRSSMGSAFRLPVITHVEPATLIAARDMYSLQIVAAAGEGEVDYTDYDWSQPTLLLLGNEGNGVDEKLMSHCDQRLKIPMTNEVESLNVATAGAVMLFESARQRRSAGL
jgi:TrmH family RNA methyltransferase